MPDARWQDRGRKWSFTMTGVELDSNKYQGPKGIVHPNIIFSYMKCNKICNLDDPVC